MIPKKISDRYTFLFDKFIYQSYTLVETNEIFSSYTILTVFVEYMQFIIKVVMNVMILLT